MRLPRLTLVVAISWLVGCTIKSSLTDSDSETGDAGSTAESGTDGAEVTGAGTQSPTEAGPTGDPTPDPASTSTTASDPDPTSTMTVSTATEDGSTTDPTGGGIEEGCMAACENAFACAPDQNPPPAECTADCVMDTDDPACVAALAAMWACVGALSCEELEKFMEGEPTMCLPQQADVEQACGGEECGIGAGGDVEGSFCMIEQTCGDESKKYTCMDGTCQCLENGVEGASCPEDGLCQDVEDLDALVMAANACCGWDI